MAKLSLEVKKRMNIVDEIRASGVNLKHESGDRYSAKCPFHQEKTPSFKADEMYQTFKCFGCGAHGDVIQYYAMQNALDYRTSMLTLAERLGLKITRDSVSYSKQKRLLELVRLVEQFYIDSFNKLDMSHPAKQQITKRNINIDDFKGMFGYAPMNPNEIVDYAISKGYKLDELKELGYVNEKGNTQLVNRLVFFIKTYMGETIGFSGRTLASSNSSFKYVNSRTSDVFDKGKTLYNVDRAKIKAKKENRLYIVEGQFDVIRMIQKGYENTVAISGTSFTKEHIKIINRMVDETGEVVLCLDGDKAGLKAALKTFRENPSLQRMLSIIFIPNDEDPCDYLNHEDTLPDSVHMITWIFNKIKEKYPPNKLENRQIFIDTLQKELTQYIEDSSLREIYLKSAYSMVGIAYQNQTREPFQKKPVEKSPIKQTESFQLKREDTLYIRALAIYMRHKDILPKIQENSYPVRYRRFIREVTSILKEEPILEEMITQKNILKAVIEQETPRFQDTETVIEYYNNIIELAYKETKKNKKKEQQLAFVQSVQGMTKEELLLFLSHTDIPTEQRKSR